MYQLLESKKAGLQYSTCMYNTPLKSNLLLLINGVLHTQVEYIITVLPFLTPVADS